MRRRIEGRRLVYYREATGAYWDDHWQVNPSLQAWTWAEEGRIGSFEDACIRHLPKEGRILDAGCGLGWGVLALRVRGYDVEGVEQSQKTVDTTRRFYPDLPIRAGDVIRLDVPDGHYRGYISLGVMEHLEGGPGPFLREAYRALSDDGVMLVSVPHFHALRRTKARLGLYRGRVEGLVFHQYAFTPGEMSEILRRAGFVIIDTGGCGGLKGIKEEVPPLRWLASIGPIGWFLQGLCFRWKWLERTFGNMRLYVCHKRST